VLVIEPGPSLAQACRDKGLLVVESFLENVNAVQLGASLKAFVSFELFEHLHDPHKFLSHLLKLMDSRDLFIFTTLSGIGIVFWRSGRIQNPYHLRAILILSTQKLHESSWSELALQF
jgi:hypothetical protein